MSLFSDSIPWGPGLCSLRALLEKEGLQVIFLLIELFMEFCQNNIFGSMVIRRLGRWLGGLKTGNIRH